jgi:hypothetical protein
MMALVAFQLLPRDRALFLVDLTASKLSGKLMYSVSAKAGRY